MKNKVIILICLTVGVGCADKPVVQEEVLRPVRYLEIMMQRGGEKRVFTGLAKPAVESKLSFKVPGNVSKLYAKIGQQVKAGGIIAVVDDSDYLLQYEEADAGVKNADAMEKSTKSNYERISILYENQNVSLAEFESAKAAFNSAKAQEKAMKQRRKLAESQLSYTRLRSPITGVIADVLVEENENVQAGQPVVVVTSSKQLEVEVSVPDLYISQIKLDDKVEVVFSAFRGEVYEGQVSEVGFAASYQTTYPVVLTLSDFDAKIRPGMSAEVSFLISDGSDGDKILIPGASVGEDRLGRFVYTIQPAEKGTGKVLRKSVEIGELSESGIEIRSGLAPGDLVVTAGVSKISEGVKVTLLN
ncbi:MAG: efflux RND transporter periplasmic adaptor subunit [Saprospiraceae bacterium]|nr:efflux RND transporter periplasmic adaptor subunit [Saprospiraceae bacterium]